MKIESFDYRPSEELEYKVKSDFQTEREAEGWTFLTNVNPNADLGNPLYRDAQQPNTNEQIRDYYQGKLSGAQVLVCDEAFARRGERMEDLRAVYIQGMDISTAFRMIVPRQKPQKDS